MTDEHRDAIADAGRTEERTGYIHTDSQWPCFQETA